MISTVELSQSHGRQGEGHGGPEGHGGEGVGGVGILEDAVVPGGAVAGEPGACALADDAGVEVGDVAAALLRAVRAAAVGPAEACDT